MSTMEIFTPEKFILSKVFGEYSTTAQMLIIQLLTKLHSMNIDFKIKVRKNKEFAITLSDDIDKNIATIWPWNDYVQVIVLRKTSGKVKCFSKEDIDEELVYKLYKKYCERSNRQLSLNLK